MPVVARAVEAGMTDPDRLRPAVILPGSGEELTAAACDTAGRCCPCGPGGKEARGARPGGRVARLGAVAHRRRSEHGARRGQPERPSRYRVIYLAGLGGTSSAGNSMATAVGWRASRTCRATRSAMPPCEGPGRPRSTWAPRGRSAPAAGGRGHGGGGTATFGGRLPDGRLPVRWRHRAGGAGPGLGGLGEPAIRRGVRLLALAMSGG